ncbi:pyridoxamine 5'-phosphate oxidase family protein [Streptomyces sp. B6B3]|uniref:pyridoxamine 5'-phosphate oxidase family protein n=1 Tax=Streptomyces sp. B6B3 TaxID=3153570 RepID=UPI00325EC2DB
MANTQRNGEPVAEVDARYSAPEAGPTPWAQARMRLAEAEVFWLTTVRPEGRPHVTPLLAVWRDEALWFCTGPEERKARNLAANAHCVLTTGDNRLGTGLDLVVEGEARRETDDAALRPVADLYETKYGEEWRFRVDQGMFRHRDQTAVALVFRVAPATAFAFRKGDYAQTRYRF